MGIDTHQVTVLNSSLNKSFAANSWADLAIELKKHVTSAQESSSSTGHQKQVLCDIWQGSNILRPKQF